VGIDPSTVGSDLQEQLAKFARRILMRHHGDEEMDWSEAAALEFAARFKPLACWLHEVAYCVADELYDEQWRTGDGARERAVRRIAKHLGCSPSLARYALQAAELGRRLPVTRLGTPSVHQLTVIAWANVKTRGWDQITAWMGSNGLTFENTSADELKAYCKKIRADAKELERARESERTDWDPHDPADAEVVEEVDGVPAAPLPPLNLTEEQRADRRKTKALVEVYGLLDKAKTVVNLNQIPDGDEELLKRLGDIDRLANLVERLRAKATPIDAELPL
jgi:hypothetical protein